MSQAETFTVERRTRSKDKNQNNQDVNQIKGSDLDLFKNLVGISYISFGVYGLFNGLFRSTKEITFKNRPKKLIVTSVLNIVGRQVSKYANAGACLFLLYSISRKSINYMFDEEIQPLSGIQRNFIYGFVSGAFFKCSRGIGPFFLAGTCMGLTCAGIVKLYEYKLISIKLH